MTAFQNDDDTFCRKSSVYNQTGETYFQQLSAYNRMSAHLRRVLLAPCVVDSRNRRYTRDKDLARARLSTSRSKSLEKIRKRGNIIDGVAYDTEHHPLDVLRMSLECNSECPGMVKRIVESCTGCDNYSARSRSDRTTRTSAGKIPRTSNDDREICTCLRSQICKPCSTSTPKRDSGKSARSTSSRVADRDDCVRKHSHENRTGKRISSRNNVEEAEKFYPYDSSFESSSGNSSTVDSPIRKDREDRRNDRDESPIVVDDNVRRANKFFGNVERNEEAKYAKFIYDVTREIMNSGSYTDHELRAIFKKHIDMNSGTLDRNKMQSEIRQLRMSLNVPAVSDDEDDANDKDDDGDDDENVDNRFVGSGKFAKLSPEKPPTPPKILDDGELAEKFRNQDEAVRHGDNRKPRDSHGKNTVVLVDANPELLITERDVLLTLMDMKLDPRQIRSICKSLRNKSRETLVSETVQVDAEPSYPRVKEDRGNSPINSRTGIRGSDFHSPHPDRTIRTPRVPIRTDICQCQCRDDITNGRYSAEKSEHRPEMGIQATTTSASRSRSAAGEKSFRSASIGSSRSKKPRDSRETDDPPSKSAKTSRESLLSSEKSPFRDGSTPPTRLGSTKSRTNRSEEMIDEREIEKIEKINSRRSTSKSRSENKRITTRSSGKSGESNGEEDEKPSKINSRRETSIASTGNGGEDDSSAKFRRSDESQRERKSTISGRRSTSSTAARNGDERKSTSFSKPETKRESKRKTTVENFNERTTKSGRNSIKNESVGSRNSSGNDENSNVAFISHSEFLNNLQRDENGSLPDISERSEVIEEDIESDEILTIGSQTTPRPSQIDEVSGDESANVSEHIDHVDEAPIAGESSMSMVSENIEQFRSASPTEVAAEEKKLQTETSRTKQIDDDEETNFDDGISRSSIRKNDSDDSPEENDSDDNERIVVATSETFLSASSMRKKTSSRISFDDDDERRETRISSVSAKRSSASLKNKMYESSEEIGAKEDSNFGTSDGDYASGKNSEEKFESDISEETKIEVRRKTRSSDDKTDDIASSETELDGVKKSNATMESGSDLEIHEEESGDRSEIENPEDSEPDEEHRESHESGEHSDRDPTTMNEISESRRIIIGAARKSDRSNDDSPEEITEISQRRKRTKSVGSKELGV